MQNPLRILHRAKTAQSNIAEHYLQFNFAQFLKTEKNRKTALQHLRAAIFGLLTV